MNEIGKAGLPRRIYFKYGGVEVDMSNNEIFIAGQWHHASGIRHWERSGLGYDIYFIDPNLPIYRWKTLWGAKQDKMGKALQIIRP